MLARIAAVVKEEGLRGLAAAAWRRIAKPTAATFAAARPLLAGGYGLEIGGPSDLFSAGNLLPVYGLARALDNCTFQAATLWAEVHEGRTFRFDPRREPGFQYLREATDLRGIPDARYDFVLSCHTLEHSANALKALREWLRVVRPGGALLLVLPHKEGTFDHRRPTTPMEHLEADLANGTTEDDLTHLPEILELHDLARDPLAGSPDAFERRSRGNASNRGLHQHVFDTRSAVELLLHEGLRVVSVEAKLPFHVILLALKDPRGAEPEPGRALLRDALRRSPFASDRHEP